MHLDKEKQMTKILKTTGTIKLIIYRSQLRKNGKDAIVI